MSRHSNCRPLRSAHSLSRTELGQLNGSPVSDFCLQFKCSSNDKVSAKESTNRVHRSDSSCFHHRERRTRGRGEEAQLYRSTVKRAAWCLLCSAGTVKLEHSYSSNLNCWTFPITIWHIYDSYPQVLGCSPHPWPWLRSIPLHIVIRSTEVVPDPASPRRGCIRLLHPSLKESSKRMTAWKLRGRLWDAKLPVRAKSIGF